MVLALVWKAGLVHALGMRLRPGFSYSLFYFFLLAASSSY